MTAHQQRMLIVSVAFVGFAYFAYLAIVVSHDQFVGIVAIASALIFTPLVMFAVTDRYYRWRIRSQVECRGSKIRTIKWRPLLAITSSVGWSIAGLYRHYEVNFVTPNGRSKSRLFACHWLLRNLSGEDFADLNFESVSALTIPIERLAIPFVAFLGVYFTVHELAYQCFGRQASAVVAYHNQSVVKPTRNSGRLWPETHTYVEFEWTESNGATYHGVHSFRGAHHPTHVEIEYLPGGYGPRLQGTTGGQTWLMWCSGFLLFFVVLEALDRFDVFGLHAARIRRASGRPS